jgi:hypothetical protein
MPLGYLIQFGQPFLGYRVQYDVLGSVTRLHWTERTLKYLVYLPRKSINCIT